MVSYVNSRQVPGHESSTLIFYNPPFLNSGYAPCSLNCGLGALPVAKVMKQATSRTRQLLFFPSLLPMQPFPQMKRTGESLGAQAKILGFADIVFSIPGLSIRSTRQAFI